MIFPLQEYLAKNDIEHQYASFVHGIFGSWLSTLAIVIHNDIYAFVQLQIFQVNLATKWLPKQPF